MQTHFNIVTAFKDRYDIMRPSEPCIVGFGDSLTQAQANYPILPDLAALMGLPIINSGLTGTKLSGASGSANSGESRYFSKVVTRPFKDKIYVLFGANDIGDAGITTQNFQDAGQVVIAGLIAAGYSARDICLCSPPFRTGYVVGSGNQTTVRTDAFRTAMVTVAAANGVRYADILQPILDAPGGPDSYLIDTLHPTVAGSAIIAQAIYTAFQGA
jgi:lysophospholipase L1-like esterase